MSTLKDLKLISRDPNAGTFVPGKMTLVLNTNGDPELIDDSEALDQDVMKAIFTKLQADGYGTVIRRVIGGKNTSVISAMLVYTVMGSLQKLVSIHDAYRKRYPIQFNYRRCLKSADFIRSVFDEKTKVKLFVEFRTREDESRGVNPVINR